MSPWRFSASTNIDSLLSSIQPLQHVINERLQTGRQDTYLNRHDEDIPTETMIKICGLQIAGSATNPLFDPSILREASQELADYCLAHLMNSRRIRV